VVADQRLWRHTASFCCCLSALSALILLFQPVAFGAALDNDSGFHNEADFGRALFFDRNLSLRRSQSCATCHDPAHAFIDARDNGVAAAASLGDDGISVGDRNAPTVTYAALSPAFHQDSDGHYIGGYFHDGRAASLASQAAQPLLNATEMAMPDAAAVASRVRAKPRYVTTLKHLYGQQVLACAKCILRAVSNGLAAFESTKLFTRFDSRYDRFLRGEYVMTKLEAQGRVLFFSPLTNCSRCHLLHVATVDTRETFSSYQYRNIGLPINLALRRKNGVAVRHQDLGLFDNPAVMHHGVADEKLKGKFKVPSLRNVAVTAPYMHNGVFAKLTTAIRFYNQYTVHNASSGLNPETGEPWGPAEVPQNIDRALLRQGQPLDEHRIQALAAFLKTLTDRRYEALLSR